MSDLSRELNFFALVCLIFSLMDSLSGISPKRVLRMPRYYRASVLACRMGHPDPLAAWRRGVCTLIGHDVFKATSELDQETAKWSIKAEERATGKQFPQAEEVASGERPYCWRCGEVLAA